LRERRDPLSPSGERGRGGSVLAHYGPVLPDATDFAGWCYVGAKAQAHGRRGTPLREFCLCVDRRTTGPMARNMARDRSQGPLTTRPLTPAMPTKTSTNLP